MMIGDTVKIDSNHQMMNGDTMANKFFGRKVFFVISANAGLPNSVIYLYNHKFKRVHAFFEQDLFMTRKVLIEKNNAIFK